MRAVAGITVGLIQAGSSMMTRVTVTFIDVNVTLFTCEPWCTDACAIQALAVTGTAVQTADVSTGVLVQFTVCSDLGENVNNEMLILPDCLRKNQHEANHSDLIRR